VIIALTSERFRKLHNQFEGATITDTEVEADGFQHQPLDPQHPLPITL
jgi:hypothetical protein